MDRITKFRRHVTLLAGTWYRIDRGLNDGRNSDATASTIDWHYAEAKRLLAEGLYDDSDPLWNYLDSQRGARLYAKWSTLERRQVGLK